MAARRQRVRVLITGMEGFAGSHLAAYALGQGAEVYGTAFPGASRKNLRGLDVAGTFAVDVTLAKTVAKLVQRVRPDRIFHLAGQSNPGASVRDPETTLRANILGTLNLLEAVRQLRRPPRVLVVGSADEYGGVNAAGRPIPETSALRPETPYGVSKVCQDLLGLAYFQRYGLHVVRVRPFNHIGPRQGLGFVATDFASQIAAIEHGVKVPSLQVGNLDVVRDFTDVRDIAVGYWRLLEAGKPGEVYNLGSGRGVRVRDLLDGLLALSTRHIQVGVRRERVRRERRSKVADISKVTRDTGWRPKIPLARTLRDILGDWRLRRP